MVQKKIFANLSNGIRLVPMLIFFLSSSFFFALIFTSYIRLFIPLRRRLYHLEIYISLTCVFSPATIPPILPKMFVKHSTLVTCSLQLLQLSISLHFHRSRSLFLSMLLLLQYSHWMSLQFRMTRNQVISKAIYATCDIYTLWFQFQLSQSVEAFSLTYISMLLLLLLFFATKTFFHHFHSSQSHALLTYPFGCSVVYLERWRFSFSSKIHSTHTHTHAISRLYVCCHQSKLHPFGCLFFCVCCSVLLLLQLCTVKVN